jgi:hypothetical protein
MYTEVQPRRHYILVRSLRALWHAEDCQCRVRSYDYILRVDPFVVHDLLVVVVNGELLKVGLHCMPDIEETGLLILMDRTDLEFTARNPVGFYNRISGAHGEDLLVI